MYAHRVLAVIAAAAMAIGVSAPAASAAPKPAKYKNCAALNKAYPAGVAQSKAAAQVAVAAGNAEPAVSVKVYGLNKRLDRDKDLVVCEAAVSAPAATPAPASGVKYTLTGIPVYDAINQSRADKGEITQAQADALTRFMNAIAAPSQNARVKVCPLWSFDVFREGYLKSALSPQVMTLLGFTDADMEWARVQLDYAVVTYCVSVGAMAMPRA